MKSIKRLLFTLLLSSLSLTVLYAQENTTFFLHTVEKGQSLYSISSMYNISKTEIIRLNPGSDGKIYAGQTLKIPQATDVKQQPIFHTIQAGETLYKLTTIYHVTVKEICDENPGLSAENFNTGEVIRIPASSTIAKEETPAAEQVTTIQQEVKSRCRDMHKVKRKETIFSISRQYGISEQALTKANPEIKDGLKKGNMLCIPYPSEAARVVPAEKIDFALPPSNRDLFRENQETTHSISTIKAALILPFSTNGERQGDVVRMVEYYEGFLLAVDSIKRKGTSVELFVYDSGSEHTSLAPILAKEELKQMDVIFGPLYAQHIKPLAAFTNAHNIRLVIPIVKDEEIFHYSNIYQVNTQQSYLYSEVYEHFTRQFLNSNVVILDMHTNDNEKKEFIDGLRAELNRKGISNQTINGNSLSQSALSAALHKEKSNVFIPSSGSAITLTKITPQLKILVKDNTDTHISLFGYPEWQTYINDNLESFFELDTYFYSSFYTSNLLPAAKEFTQLYRKWYSKEMVNSYPKYGMLGFDTALFFFSGLAQYGTGLEQHLTQMKLTPIQTGFKFDRVNNWGGFINKKVFFVHFTKEYELIKLDFD